MTTFAHVHTLEEARALIAAQYRWRAVSGRHVGSMGASCVALVAKSVSDIPPWAPHGTLAEIVYDARWTEHPEVGYAAHGRPSVVAYGLSSRDYHVTLYHDKKSRKAYREFITFLAALWVVGEGCRERLSNTKQGTP